MNADFSERFNETIDFAVNTLNELGVDDWEITAIDRFQALTRYANSTIHQNVADHVYRLSFRIAKNKKLYTFSLSDLAIKTIEKHLQDIKAILARIPAITFYQGLIEPNNEKPPSLDATGPLMDEFQRAEMVEQAISSAEAVNKDIKLAGSVYITDLRFRIINSNDIDVNHRITVNGMSVNAISELDQKGYGRQDQVTRYPETLNPDNLAQRAAELSVSACKAKSYPTGDYEVILSASATASILRFMAFAFNATGYHEGQSFIVDKIGEKILDEKLNLYDDPLDNSTMLASPIDGEGSIKRTIPLIEEGIPKTVIYNSFLASRYLKDKTKTTGHHVIPFSDYFMGGVAPLNLILSPGDMKAEEMIEETKRGFFINRLHYTNYVNRKLGIITGLTRDGLLYIENGEIVGAAKNFRFTDAIPSFMTEIKAIGKELEKGTMWIAPPIHLESFRFSGKTKH
ncbi:MAG: TldD/PmbA family protein [Candidatus Heimdallarchaeaceae archaeon]